RPRGRATLSLGRPQPLPAGAAPALGALRSLRRTDRASGSSRRRVQGHGGANERRQRLFIDLVALVGIDGTPGVAFEAGVEEARGSPQAGPLGEVLLRNSFVPPPGPDDPGARPPRTPPPLPPPDALGVGLLDERSDPREHPAPPVAQLLD